jgi:osmotically-inducible protein OsmY
MDDKTMSINAQNCKIVTDKAGKVTLRGVVNSQTEKDAIELKAKSASGVSSVDNQLEVKPN